MQSFDSNSKAGSQSVSAHSSQSTSLFSLELSSIAAGYRALDALTKQDDIRVLEASTIGDRFLILVSGAPAELKQASHRARLAFEGSDTDLWLDSELLEDISPKVLEAVFSLSQTLLAESLIVVECKTVSGCLSIAQTLVDGHGVEAIEIKIQRSSSGGAYGFFTGSETKCGPGAEDARTKLKAAVREGKIELISHPSHSLRDFFDFTSPQK